MVVGDNAAQCDIILDVFEDAMKIAYYSESFGGTHPMTQAQIDFIDNWEVENYRRSVAAGASAGRAENKTIIASELHKALAKELPLFCCSKGANIVVVEYERRLGRCYC